MTVAPASSDERRVSALICRRMSTARIRPLLAAIAVAAVFVYGLSGHGMGQMSHDEMAGAAAGLCLLLATAVAYGAAPKAAAHHPGVVADAAATYVAAPPNAPLDGRARASPVALQRFRN
jgi:hypothetical protein